MSLPKFAGGVKMVHTGRCELYLVLFVPLLRPRRPRPPITATASSSARTSSARGSGCLVDALQVERARRVGDGDGAAVGRPAEARSRGRRRWPPRGRRGARCRRRCSRARRSRRRRRWQRAPGVAATSVCRAARRECARTWRARRRRRRRRGSTAWRTSRPTPRVAAPPPPAARGTAGGSAVRAPARGGRPPRRARPSRRRRARRPPARQSPIRTRAPRRRRAARTAGGARGAHLRRSRGAIAGRRAVLAADDAARRFGVREGERGDRQPFARQVALRRRRSNNPDGAAVASSGRAARGSPPAWRARRGSKRRAGRRPTR